VVHLRSALMLGACAWDPDGATAFDAGAAAPLKR
jgi:hypothetical protein